MTKTKQILLAIAANPMTAAELREKFGDTYSCVIDRLIKRGAAERFLSDTINRIWKYRAIGIDPTYWGGHYKDTPTLPARINKAAKFLRAHGYTVCPPMLAAPVAVQSNEGE